MLLALGLATYLAVARSLETAGVHQLEEREQALSRLMRDSPPTPDPIRRSEVGFAFGGPGSGGFGGMGSGGFGGMGSGNSSTVSEAQATSGLIELTIYGIVTLYEKYDDKPPEAVVPPTPAATTPAATPAATPTNK